MKLAVDFDGTLCKHRYPEIGEPLSLGIEFLKDLRKQGVKVYLDTMRCGKELEEAVEWCKARGLEFDSIGPHKSQFRWTTSRKTHADYSLDDRNIGVPVLYDEEGRPYVDWPKMIEEFKKRILADKQQSES